FRWLLYRVRRRFRFRRTPGDERGNEYGDGEPHGAEVRRTTAYADCHPSSSQRRAVLAIYRTGAERPGAARSVRPAAAGALVLPEEDAEGEVEPAPRRQQEQQ